MEPLGELISFLQSDNYITHEEQMTDSQLNHSLVLSYQAPCTMHTTFDEQAFFKNNQSYSLN